MRLARQVVCLSLLLSGVLHVYAQNPTPRPLLAGIALPPPHAAPDGWSFGPSLSTSGQRLAFVSTATNLVPADLNLAADVFVYRLDTAELRRVSLASDGTPGDAASFEASLSADGQQVVFTSLATNLTAPAGEPDSNGVADIYLHDLGTATTRRVSVATDGRQSDAWSDQPAISGDGRWVVFRSAASNLDPADQNPGSDIFLHDRLNRETRLVSHFMVDSNNAAPPAPAEATHPAISRDGRVIVYLLRQGAGTRLMLYDRLTRRQVTLLAAASGGFRQIRWPALSATGSAIAFWADGPAGEGIYLLERGQPENAAPRLVTALTIAGARPARPFALADGGQALVFWREGQLYFQDFSNGSKTELGGMSPGGWLGPGSFAANGQSFVAAGVLAGITDLFWLENPLSNTGPSRVTGWVSDGQGYPIANVKLSATGRSAWTDSDGNFTLEVGPASRFNLLAEKEGYTFTPASYNLAALQRTGPAVGLEFQALPEKLLAEARLDLGMPYALDRGCPSPFEPCGGPFHGFYRGDCTDLVMDGFRAGLAFNIQFALQRDFYANPRHYYRWRDARNAHDMWRYFSYSQQILPPEETYLPGDIVFFDWELDGIIDHVALIAEVNSRGQPRVMLDATGVIADNPGGLATELDWKAYHRAHTPGHARWLGRQAPRAELPAGGAPVLLLALDGPQVRLELSPFASGPPATAQTQPQPASISAVGVGLAGGWYHDNGYGEVISLEQPAVAAPGYLLTISGTPGAPYQLAAQLVVDRQIRAVTSTSGVLPASGLLLIPLEVVAASGEYAIHLTLP